MKEQHGMIQITSNIQIYKPIKQVFDFISIPENDFQWQYGTLASMCVIAGMTGLGTCFQTTTLFMGHRVHSSYEVIEYKPNAQYSFKSLSGPLQSFTFYTLDIAQGCTQMKASVEANIINLVEISEKVLEKKMKKQLKENLAMLKSILETG